MAVASPAILISAIWADIFGSFFGGGFGGGSQARRNGPMRGETIRTSISISFEEAAFGCEKDVIITRTENCSECGGTGCAKGTTAQTCPDCHGSGTVQIRRQTPMVSLHYADML